MPTTSRTAARRPCAWSARATPTCSPRSRPASARCGDRCTAGPTRPASRCSKQIRADGGDVAKYVDMAKDKNSGFRLMGFGHRVYKNFDPRATIIKRHLRQAAGQAGNRRSDLRDRQAARSRSRSATRTSSSASSIPTSISIPASSTGRSAFRCRCSRCCSPSAGCRAGSPTGWKCTTRPPSGSAARGRSTPARTSATSCRVEQAS